MTMRRYLILTRYSLLSVCAAHFALTLFGSASAQQSTSEAAVDFAREVRPILADNCFYCHGPDAGQRVTELRFDTREGAFADLGGYTAIAPGNIEESELVRRIRSTDAYEVMPPPEHRKKLSEAQKQTLQRWIAQGAAWSTHWSFVPPIKVPNPQVQDGSWPVNFVDHFILAKLESKGISPSTRADNHTLLRRLSFDLTGLPPDPGDLSEFSASSESSYEAAIDRLLASEHFGERLAVYWLDLVRYADSVGYHGDQPISVSPYRDYVIEAFNGNKPFDQFTREQLAGDLLANPQRDQLVASGYNRLGMMSAEGGVQPEEYLAKYAADRVRTTASVWLGVTLGCAECHDHKFDPFTTTEFYQFASFFSDIKERGLYEGAHESKNWGPSIEVPDDSLPALLEPLDVEIATLEQQLVETPEIAASRIRWEQRVRQANFQWQTLQPLDVRSSAEVQSQVLDDGSVLIGGPNPNENVLLVTADLPPGKPRAFRLEVLPHESLPRKGPGRAGNGNFVLTEFLALRGDQREHIQTLKRSAPLWPSKFSGQQIPLKNASATVEQTQGGEKHPDKRWSAASAIDGDVSGSSWGWAVLPETGKASEFVVQLDDPQLDTTTITFVLQQYHGQGNHTVGRFRLSASTSSEATADPFHSLPGEIRLVLNTDDSLRTGEQRASLASYYLTIAPELKSAREQIAKLRARRTALVAEHTRSTLITQAVSPRPMRVLPRGNWMDKSGPQVEPGVPVSLQPSQWEGRGTRLDLANWIVDQENPLAARVFVNRLWRLFFGAGLSNVLDDLGAQGEPPTHPELLDRLAIEFMESGWDVKHLIKLMVMSQTYRQSSAYRDELRGVDPENRLLARQSRYRLDAEFIRDHALAVSGLLVRRTGGRSVKPYQPEGLYRHLNFPKRAYQADHGPDQYRRGLYTHWQRQYLHPAMRVFDAPAREECTAARPRSSTPLAALVLLNDPSYVEASRSFAQQALKQADDFALRLDWIFMMAFSRPPGDEESGVLGDLLESHREFYRSRPDQAEALLSTGASQRDATLDLVEHAAWTSVCRAVLNMHEFVIRY